MLFNAYYLGRHRKTPLVITTVAEIDALIDDLLRQDLDHRLASLTQDRNVVDGHPAQLKIGVDDDGMCGVLCHWSDNGRYFSLGPLKEPGERDYFLCGSSFHFPASARIPLRDVRASAAEFIASGGEMPRNVAWQEAV